MDRIGIETITSQSSLFIGSVIFLWLSVATLTAWYRLRHIPGPWIASISNLWIIKASTSKKLAEVFEKAGDKYGPLVRIGPNQILTSDADFLRRTSALRGTYNKSQWYKAFRCMILSFLDSVVTYISISCSLGNGPLKRQSSPKGD